MYSDSTHLMERGVHHSRGSRQAPWDASILERPRYFPRQLMTPSELMLEQEYFRDKLRRHNRMLHGWGVVCGAIVCRVPCRESSGTYTASERAWPCPEECGPEGWHPWNVSVSSGYILGPYGDEILINTDVIVDVRKSCTTGVSGDICPPAPDPWCSDVIIDRAPGPLYLAVRYTEIATRPVRVQPAGCGCDDTACEYSRIRDGFEICTLDECPDSHREDPPSKRCEIRACQPCPDSPWVVLARIDIDANGIVAIDNYDCRRVLIDGQWCYPEPPSNCDTDDDRYDRERLERRAREVILRSTDLQEGDIGTLEEIREVPSLPAVELRGVTANSQLGRHLATAEMTISRIGSMRQEEFTERMVREIDSSRPGAIQTQASEVWEHAQRIVRAVDALEHAYTQL